MMTAPLSAAEMRVLHLRAQGLTAKAVAFRLGVSEQTVKNHGSAIFDSLGVDNLASALSAIGWLTVPDIEPSAPEFCQWVGKCGRRYGHRGQHGGFRQQKEV